MPIPTSEQLIAYSELSPRERREVNKDVDNFPLFFSYYYSEYIKYSFAEDHEKMFQDLADLHNLKIRELVWSTTRDFAKTSFSKGFLVWMIATENVKYYNQDAFDKGNSEKILYDCIIELQTNNRLKQDYGNLFNSPASMEEKQSKKVSDFNTTNGIRVEAHSIGQSVRGRLHKSNRPDFFCLDDFEVITTSRSEKKTQEIREHLSELKPGMAQSTGRILYLCNFITETGIVADLKARAEHDPMLRFRSIPRVDENGKPTWPARDVMTDAELLLPGNENKVSIESVKRSMWTELTGDADWLRECQLQPVDPMGDGPDTQDYSALFPEDFRKSVVTDEPFNPQNPHVLGVDPAAAGHDKSVVVVRNAFQAKVFAEESKSTEKSLAQIVLRAMKEYSVPAERVVIDAFGVGFKVVQELSLLGHAVKAVNVGEKDIIELGFISGFINDRAYGFFKLKDWLAHGGKLCYNGDWDVQLKCIRHRTNEKEKRQIISKKEIIKRGFKSPDKIDALMLSCLVDTVASGGRLRTADDAPISKFL